MVSKKEMKKKCNVYRNKKRHAFTVKRNQIKEIFLTETNVNINNGIILSVLSEYIMNSTQVTKLKLNER